MGTARKLLLRVRVPVDSDRLFVEAADRFARLVANPCMIAMLSDGESR